MLMLIPVVDLFFKFRKICGVPVDEHWNILFRFIVIYVTLLELELKIPHSTTIPVCILGMHLVSIL